MPHWCLISQVNPISRPCKVLVPVVSSGFSIDGFGILFLPTKSQKPNGTLKYCCLLLKNWRVREPSSKNWRVRPNPSNPLWRQHCPCNRHFRDGLQSCVQNIYLKLVCLILICFLSKNMYHGEFKWRNLEEYLKPGIWYDIELSQCWAFYNIELSEPAKKLF